MGPLILTFNGNIVVRQTKSLHIQFVFDTVAFVLLCVFILAVMTKLVFVCLYLSLTSFYSPPVLAKFWGDAVQRQAGGRREEEL